ncbi:MAG: nuoM [Verrucomicrobiaceae bacterium]|nr:nuoM [Verrucomicrobiaceae bacterium]
MSPLEIVILLPLLAAALIGAGLPAKLVGRVAALANLIVVIGLWLQFPGATADGSLVFKMSRQILDNPSISFAVGADGMSLILALLTTIVTVAAIWQIVDKPAIYYVSSLMISAGALGAFLTTDVFFIYSFHELALIPTLLMIALHGQGDATERRKVAWKTTVYLGVGSLVLLAGLVALVLNFSEGGKLTFDLTALLAVAKNAPLAAGTQAWIFFVLLLGFGTLVSLFPMHSWAAPAYATAPTPVAMLHSGVLKKFGLYGLIRIALPLLPLGAKAEWVQQAMLWMLLGNIIIIGLVTIHQTKLDSMLGNSSVMHMGYIFLGIAAGSELALRGAVLLMFAHGVSIALLFALCGKMRNQLGSLEFSKLGGLAKNAPFMTVIFGFAAFASIGLPGLANFPGELMVFAGAFDSRVAGLTEGLQPIHWATIVALWGVVMSAVYMLRAYRSLFFGAATAGHFIRDPDGEQRLPLLLLTAVLVVVGFRPGLLIDLLDFTLNTAKAAGL